MINTPRFLCEYKFLFLLSKYLEVWLLNHIGSICLIWKLFSKMEIYHFAFPTVYEFLLLCILITTWYFHFFYCCWYTVVCTVVLICISLVMNDAEHLLMSMFLVKCLLDSCPFLYSFVLLLNFESSFYILDTCPLSMTRHRIYLLFQSIWLIFPLFSFSFSVSL